MEAPQLSGMNISTLTLQDLYNIYGNDMEVTLHFSEDGLWCLEGKYELGETDVVTEIQTKVGMEKVSQWRHQIIPLGILKLYRKFRIRTKRFQK